MSATTSRIAEFEYLDHVRKLDAHRTTLISTALASLLLYGLIRTIWRLYFHPLAKFPGPKLAAATIWYEGYYDVILGGQYTFKIARLHEEYGPIVRINPFEIHVLTPSFYETLYAGSGSGKKRDKWEWYTKQLACHESTQSTVGHDHHRIRRSVLNRYFSMGSVLRLQPIIQERLDLLIERLSGFKGTGKVFRIDRAYSAYTNDVVMEYSFARSDNRLEAENFAPDFIEAVENAAKSGAFLKQFGFMVTVVRSMPDWLAIIAMPMMASGVRAQRRLHKLIVDVKKSPDAYQDVAHPTVFNEVLNSKLDDREKTNKRLTEEATILIGAGTGTTSWALSVATFHLLSNPSILQKLKYELHTAIPDPSTPPSISFLQNLPYLSAVIQEGLRLSYGVSSRLERVSPDEPLVFHDDTGDRDWVIPPGTPVSMTSLFIHHDESIFPNSYSFIPERWLDNPKLERYLVSFSKGSRQCLGINLAYAEMFMCLAAVFRRFGTEEVKMDDDQACLELFETADEDDVRVSRDFFTPFPKASSKGIRVRVV